MMRRFRNPCDLNDRKREPLLDFDRHYDYTVGMALRAYDVVAKGIAQAGPNPTGIEAALMTGTQRRAWDALKHLLVSYSAGNPIAELREFYPTLLGYWEEYAKYSERFNDCPGSNGRRIAHLQLGIDGYARTNALICMALLLGWAEVLPRIAVLLDYENDVHDILLETCLHPFLHGRPAGTEYVRHLPYRKLQKVFDAAPDKRPALMERYMDDWYEASRHEPYYEQHKRETFTGYWSWEAAAITWLFEIDDSSYRRKPHYPAELVNYARAQYTPAQAIKHIS
jgi:hypothetical protein